MKIRIDNYIVLSLIILPLFEPRGIIDMATSLGGFWGIVDNIFSAIFYLSILISVLVIGANIKKYKPTSLVLLTIAYNLLFVLSCIVNNNFSYYCFFISMRAIYTVVLFDYLFQKQYSLKVIKVISFWLIFFVAINFLTIVIFKNGMYADSRGWYTRNFFLGNKNLFLYVFIPCLTFTAALCQIRYGKMNFKYYLLLVLIIPSCLLTSATTATITMILFAVLLFFFEKINLPKWITLSNIFILFTLLTFGFIFLNFQVAFNNILMYLFSKDSTFTSRLYIWNQALQHIIANPIIGGGNLLFDMSSIRSWTTGQAHNKYLDILSISGLVGYVLFFAIVFVCGRKLTNYKNNKFKNIIFYLFLCYFILFLMEARREDATIFALFSFAFHIDDVMSIKRRNTVSQVTV